MTRRAGAVLIIALCALSLTLHFAAESLGEIQSQLGNGTSAHAFDMHEGDQFVLDESGNDHPLRADIRIPFLPGLIFISQTLAPLLQPPIVG